jgi:beta-N-acetylhexosaminidase
LKKIFFIVLSILLISISLGVNRIETLQQTALPEKAPFNRIATPWADSIFLTLSLDEKIGQLFSVAAYSNLGAAHKKEILDLINELHIGGLTFFQGGPVRQAMLTNEYQEAAKIPLMIAIDGEWGLSMRLDSTVKYPWQMTLGAIQNDSLIYQMGLQVAEQFRRLGVHVNFAPVVDVNNNPNNPVIFARSFGEDKYNVAQKGIAYMKGMQAGGLLANAKHFPGHGDTDKDSHKTLPVVSHDMARIDSIELYPFKQIIQSGIGSMMTAHLYLPELTSEKKASSLTKEIVDTLLQQQLGFDGLIFTDGLNMGGVAKYQTSEEIDLQALIAGNDVLLLSQDVPKAIELIKVALLEGRLSQASIDNSVMKVLKAKEWLKIESGDSVELKNLYEDLNQPKFECLNRQLSEASLTVIRNKGNRIPFKKIAKKRIVSLAFTDKQVDFDAFQDGLNLYAKVDRLSYTALPVSAQKALMDTLLTYEEVIVSIHKSNKHPWIKADLNTEFKNFLNILRLKKKVSLVLFGNAYCLQDFLAAEFTDVLVVAYQNSKTAQSLTAQLFFGGVKANGKLPVSVSTRMKAGMGLEIADAFRMKYTLPEELGLRTEDFAAIDSIVEEGIRKKAFPGAQVYVAKDGNVIYHKAFGNPTYESSVKVKKTDLYDIASVTKITSTLLTLMYLEGKGKLSLDDNLGQYLKMTKGTVYEDLVLRDILAHQAGLAAWIPFYNKTVTKGQPKAEFYAKDSSAIFSNRVTANLFIKSSYKDTIFSRIINGAKVNKKKEYNYSDVGYYFMKEIVEKITKQPIDQYNAAKFYEPLGMSRTAFKPTYTFPLAEIIPTERDTYFRQELIHGDVHDPGAAMLGGVGGHAGLFSTANDLGKLMQMYLDDGVFSGERYLQSGIVATYAKCQFCEDSIPINEEENRRAAGFDKPQFHGTPGPTCDCVSMNSFGHSGFTGTLAWADPEEGVVYIFLSNRIYPDATNRKLLSLNIRTRIQEEIYKAINKSKMRTSQSSIN